MLEIVRPQHRRRKSQRTDTDSDTIESGNRECHDVAMSIPTKGPWNREQIDEYLGRHEFPMRLSAIGHDGFPRVVSLWYQYRDGEVQCVTHRSSSLARLLVVNNRVGFEVSTNGPPYIGVRGQALASTEPLGDSTVLKDSLNNYLGGLDSSLAIWLLSRSDEELLIHLKFQRLYSWDYRHRMPATD